MSQCFAKARELGELLLTTEEGKRLEKARSEFSANANAVSAFGEFSANRDKIQESVSHGALTREEYDTAVKDLTSQIMELKKDPIIAELYDAESVFFGFVNHVLDIVKTTVTGEAPDGCGGGCDGCAGCK